MNGLEIPILTTERLRLRAFQKSDIADYAALNADPEVLRYIGGGEPWDRGRSWRHQAFLIGHWQLGGAGMWAMEQRETGAFLGMVGFAAPEGWPGFELAWTLMRRWWGRGYATEGAREALAYAFTSLEKESAEPVLIRPGGTGPPSGSRSGSASGCKSASTISGGKGCAMGSTGKPTRRRSRRRAAWQSALDERAPGAALPPPEWSG